MPVPQQLAQIPILPTRYPDLGKIILQHEFQNQLRILPVRLLLADSPGADFCSISNPQLKRELGQQSFEPASVSAGFHPHTHLLARSRQSTVELLRLLAMPSRFSWNSPVSVSMNTFC